MSLELQPRIYVASLSDYNAGVLHGAWLDPTEPVEDLAGHIEWLLANSPNGDAEEVAIHDYEGFGPVALSEYEDLSLVARLAAGIAEHGAAFAAWASYLGRSQWESELNSFGDRYLGHCESLSSWAVEVLEACDVRLDAHVPAWLAPHVRIDLEAFASDLALDYAVVESPNGVWIFTLT